FAAMAVGNKGNHLFAVTAGDMASYVDAEAKALARCNQEVSDCRIQAIFSGAGKCGFAAVKIANVWLFGKTIERPRVITAATETEAMEKCQTIYRSCYIFHMGCNSP